MVPDLLRISLTGDLSEANSICNSVAGARTLRYIFPIYIWAWKRNKLSFNPVRRLLEIYLI